MQPTGGPWESCSSPWPVGSSLWLQRGTTWPCWNVSNRAATRAHPSSAPSWPGCSPSCCATTPCTACATCTTFRATPSSAGWPSTLSCCRRTRWWWQWPRDPPSSPHPTPPLSPTLTATSPPRRTGRGPAEPARLGPSASLRDIPPPRQRVGPRWAGSPRGYPGTPRGPQLCTSPRGSNKPRAAGTAAGAAAGTALTRAGQSGTSGAGARGWTRSLGAALGAVWGGFPGAGGEGGAESACPSFCPSLRPSVCPFPGATGAWSMDETTPTHPPITGRAPAPTVAPRGDARAAQPIRTERGFQTGGARAAAGPDREPRPRPGTATAPTPTRRAGPGTRPETETSPIPTQWARTGNRDREPRPARTRRARSADGSGAESSRSRGRARERCRAMQRARTPAAQKQPRRTPLQELKLQSGADRTSLTPLLRRLRLKDHDCATPVSCARGPRSSITTVPCAPGAPRSATLEPPSSTTVESPRTSTHDLGTPILKPGASEAPSNATLVPGALETSSSTSPEAPGSPVPVSSMPELPDDTVSAPVSSPVLGPSTQEPSSSTVPASVCSSIPVPSTQEPSSSTVPASVCSSIPVPSTPECSSSTVPVSVCSSIPLPSIPECSSSIPVPSTPEPSSSTIPVSLCSSIPVSGTPVPGTPEPSSSTIPVPLCSSILGSSTPECSSSTVPVSLCSSIPVPSTPERSSSTIPVPLCSSILGSSTPEPSSSTVPASVCSSIPVPSTPERSSSTIPVPLCSSILGSSTPECPGHTVPVSPCSSIPVGSILESPGSTMCSLVLGPCALESPGSTTPGLPSIISSVSCNPKSPGSSALPPCSAGSPGNASTAACTPGPPGTTSTPQKTPFRRWRAAPPDFSCSSVASEPPSANGSADHLHCQGTPEGAEFPVPVPPEQSPPGLPPIEASGLEPAGSEATVTPVTSPESTLGAVSWMLPLVWLEKTLNTSFLVESLRHSLPLRKVQQDASSSVTPVPTAVASTSTTPVPTVVAGTSITPVSTVVTGTSTTPVPTVVTGTSTTPVPTVVAGTSTTPVPTVVTGTSMTPVPTVVAGTSTTPVPTTAIGTSMTPVPSMATGTSMTPVLSVATGTFMTPRDVWERSMNTSRGSLPCAKDSAAETDSLLWHCPREQLKTLPRAELEGRLESTLIIIEALSLQLRDWQESQRPRPGVGPARQRDVLTQTDTTDPEGSTWSSQSLLFRGLADATFRSLQDVRGALVQEQEQERTLVSQCQAVPESAPSKVQSCLGEWDAIRQRVDEALRAKDQGYLFLEAFCAHASAQISARDQSLASQQELSMLLAQAIDLQASLSAETQSFREFLDATFENLQKERRALDEEREQMRALVSQSCALLERVPGKLQSCLEELAATRERAEEALQAKEEVSCQLHETLVTLQDTEAQLEQLTVANSRLGKDLSSVMINLASMEQERDALQQENEKQCEEMAQLAQERNTLQQDCKGLCQELQEATECREFLDQENQMCRTQLLEVEGRLNSTLARLQECVLQHDELMESHQRLREEKAALSKELDSTKAELLSLQTKRNKVSWCSTDIMESKMRLQELADCLKAALEEQDDDDAPSRSKAWTPGPLASSWQTPRRAWTPAIRTPAFHTPAFHTPHRAGSSFVGSVLKAVAGKDASETTRSGSKVAKDKLASMSKAIDPEDTLLESVKELRAVVSSLTMLSSRIQELEQSEFRALQTEISELQLRLETLTAESQEKVDAQAATIAKLNKALRTKLENEKELQDVVKQQEEKMLQLIDKSGEVMRLKAEVSDLKRLLQRAETEAKVLWEEMRGKEHQVDTAYIQERVMLRREVDKLRLLLVEKENENIRLNDNYQEQVRGLDMKLHHTQKVLRTHEEMQKKIKEVLSAVPEVALGCQELQSLLHYLGLKPASKEAAEPL
ncbi:sperm-associated antigen 5 [Passer domesticus]|uniref:sperm-associated antigen 5 n=1 Tax=Passer domesticus TaxID=48849 RepID=UPI0030FED078